MLSGLSLGSLIARALLITHPGEVEEVALAGTGQMPVGQFSMVCCSADYEVKTVWRLRL